jgi:hypothetical protein
MGAHAFRQNELVLPNDQVENVRCVAMWGLCAEKAHAIVVSFEAL